MMNIVHIVLLIGSHYIAFSKFLNYTIYKMYVK